MLPVLDAIWKYVGGDRLAATMMEARGHCLLECLQGLARLRGGAGFADDFTAVQFEGGRPDQ